MLFWFAVPPLVFEDCLKILVGEGFQILVCFSFDIVGVFLNGIDVGVFGEGSLEYFFGVLSS